MPRLPKPKQLRQNRERQDWGLVSIDGGAGEVPECPSDLLPEVAESWERFWRSPLAQTVTPDTDLPAVERLFGLRDERERAWRIIRAARVVSGSMGQERASPFYAVASALDSEIRQLEDRLGLSPQARLRLGVQLGEAARSLADINAALNGGADAEAADLLLSLARPDAADARHGGHPVDGVQPRSRAGRRAG